MNNCAMKFHFCVNTTDQKVLVVPNLFLYAGKEEAETTVGCPLAMSILKDVERTVE